jgi:hypothetical protein
MNRHGAAVGYPWAGERSVNCPSAKTLPRSSASRRYGRREAHRRPSWSPTSPRIRARSPGRNIAVPRTILRATFRLTNAPPAASTANNSSGSLASFRRRFRMRGLSDLDQLAERSISMNAVRSPLSGAPNLPRVSATYPAITSTRRRHRSAGAAGACPARTTRGGGITAS